MKTIISILGITYYLWIKGTKIQGTEDYQDWYQAWTDGDMVSMAFHITQEDDKDAPRLAFVDGQLELFDSDEQGSVFGYIWCSEKGMQSQNTNYEHGLVGMRYGHEKAKNTVFADATSLEFRWRLAVSKTVWGFMKWKAGKNMAPSGLGQPKSVSKPLAEIPEIMKANIKKLSFQDKLKRFLRKPTTAVFKAIVEEFKAFESDRMDDVLNKLANAGIGDVEGSEMAELVIALHDIYNNKEPVTTDVPNL